MQAEEEKQPEKKNIKLLSVVASVLSAFFGVQSKKNKERDFTQGSHKVFIIVGAVITLVLIATLFTVVQLVTR